MSQNRTEVSIATDFLHKDSWVCEFVRNGLVTHPVDWIYRVGSVRIDRVIYMIVWWPMHCPV